MEITPQILIAAGGVMFSMIGAYGATRYAAGKNEQRITQLEAISEQRDDTLHKRITKAQEENTKAFDRLDATLEKLDGRIIEVIKGLAEMRGPRS